MISVCIPTMPGRESTLSRLLHQLEPFTDAHRYEVLIHQRIAPMGDKLNELFAAANGRYVVCVDDDDLFLPGMVLPPGGAHEIDVYDFIGWHILVKLNGQVAGTVEHRFGQDPDALWNSHRRGVSPKCAVRTELARMVTFGNEYTADRAWSRGVQALCLTGHFIDEIAYIYDHHDNAMLGTNPGDKPDVQHRHVGMWPYRKDAFTWLA